MKLLTTILVLFTLVSVSQNSSSSLITNIYGEFDKHFNKVGIKCVNDTTNDNYDKVEIITDLVFRLEKSDEWIFTKDSTKKFLDQYMLNEFYYSELPKEFVLSDIKFLKKAEIKFKSACIIDIVIKRMWIRYNPFILNKQIKYRVTVTYVFILI
jgi:hypothetical protein